MTIASPPAERPSARPAPPASASSGRGGVERWILSAGLPLGLIALAALLVQGGLYWNKTWLWTGDTIYHRALMAEILNGELQPGGPYAGLPAFYSPLYHYLAAGLAALFRFDPLDGIKLLSVLAAPLTPLAGYYLTRVLGFDRSIALVSAFFAAFGGGLKLAADRVWVDSLFTGQHNFFPLFPRDPAFLLLPLGLAWIYRGLIDGWRPGPVLAGLAFGVMILVHTQTAVFAAPLIALYLLVVVVLRRGLLRRAIGTSAITATVALAISSWWWISMLAAIVRGGSFSVQMPAYRVPVKLEPAEFPLEFGVFLPLGLLGLAMTARMLLRTSSPAALLLLVWWAAPVLLAVLRPTDFPGGDTFFPRRLWQFASQPLVIMAAFALMAGILRPLRLRGPLAGGALLGVGLLASVPGSWGTLERIGEFWNDTYFADTEFDLNGNFAYGAWLAQQGRAEGPRTVLVPTPDATMVWYYAGQKVVSLYPTAAVKLAFDVGRLTGFGTAEREADLSAAYSGDPTKLAEVARKYAASYVVLRRDGDRLGAVDLPAAALRGTSRDLRRIETNHYEFLRMGQDDTARFSFESPTEGTATVTLRARRRTSAPRISGRLVANGAEFPITEGETPRDEYADITRAVPLRAGRNEVRFEAAAAFELARFVAYTLPLELLASDFRVAYSDPYSVILTPR